MINVIKILTIFVLGLMLTNYQQTAYSIGVAPLLNQSNNLNTIGMTQEIWKPVKGYEGLYEVSNLGRVKTLVKKGNRNEFVMTPTHSKYGYMSIHLYKNTERKRKLVHRLIAIAFIENPENKATINHENGVHDDNRIENLTWATQKENNQHAYDVLKRKGPSTGKFGKDNPGSKIIYQLSMDGKVLKKFYGLRDAGRQMNLNYKNISGAALGSTKSCGGYKWQYEKP